MLSPALSSTPTQTAEAPAGSSALESSPLLEIEELSVSFSRPAAEKVQAVDRLSLTVHPRQTLAVVGESGCGKSVTAMTILQLVPRPPARIERGVIRFEGRNLLDLDEKQMLEIRGGRIAMIFQEPVTSLNPVFTVGDQIIEAIRLHQRVSRREARAIAEQALSEVGLARPHQALRSYPHEFSGGMCQRAMTAMALACKPRLLLADEPTTALDVTIQAQILDLLEDLKQQTGMGIMLITHDLGVVAEVADVVCVMYAGNVVEYATVFDLFARPCHPYTRGLFSCLPRSETRSRRLRTVGEVVSDPQEYRRLPGHEYGIVPWWPATPPPDDLVTLSRMHGVAEGEGGDHVLHEVDRGHWVACWRTEYVAGHPLRKPDLAFRRRWEEDKVTGER